MEKVYSIPEAIRFLREEYGAENMPTSEETLRRAVRSRQLLVQESGDPGRKGYTISEKDLRQYAQNRLDRIRKRRENSEIRTSQREKTERESQELPIPFPELCGQRMAGMLTSEMYYLGLFSEKMKWEARISQKREQLKQLEVQSQILMSDIARCQSEIDAYLDGISKYHP